MKKKEIARETKVLSDKVAAALMNFDVISTGLPTILGMLISIPARAASDSAKDAAEIRKTFIGNLKEQIAQIDKRLANGKPDQDS